MDAALRNLLPKLFPEFLEYEHWLIIHHQGKSDLERSYPRKMREWLEPGVRFIIFCDNDGGGLCGLETEARFQGPGQCAGVFGAYRLPRTRRLVSWGLGCSRGGLSFRGKASKFQKPVEERPG